MKAWSHINVHTGSCTVHNTDEAEQRSAIMHVLILAPRFNLAPGCKDTLMSLTWCNASHLVSGCLTRQQPQKQSKYWKKPGAGGPSGTVAHGHDVQHTKTVMANAAFSPAKEDGECSMQDAQCDDNMVA